MSKYTGTKTEKNLLAAFAGESQARNKYTYFSQIAKDEGNDKIAEIFTKTANNEENHAKMWLTNIPTSSTFIIMQKRTLVRVRHAIMVLNGRKVSMSSS